MVSVSRAATYCCVFSWLGLLITAAKPPLSQTPPPTIHSAAEALRAQDYAKALELARALVRQEPGDSRAWVLEGIALSKLGQAPEGLRAFRHALEISPDSVAALEGAAQIEYNSGRWQEAGAYLDKLVRLDPHQETAHAMLGALAFRRKDCAATVAHFNQSWQVVENSLPALKEYGVCLIQIRHPEQAVPVFARMIDLMPEDWYARYNLALMQYQAHQNADAIATLQPLVNGPKPNADALNLLAAAYEADHQTPLALKALQEAISLAPRNPDNYLDLGVLCLDHSSFQVGVDVLSDGLRVIPDSAPLYIQRGVLYIEMLRFDQADADFERANVLDPHQDKGTLALGISLLQASKPDRSVSLVRARLQKTPNSPTLNYLLAEALLRKGVRPGSTDFNEAVAAARRSVHADPNFVLAYNVLTELYLRCDKAKEAIAASRAALKIDPHDQAAAYHLIVALRKTGDKAELPKAVEQLAEITAEAKEEGVKRNRFRLVEMGADSAKDVPITLTGH